jgi:SSS family transporter
MLSVGFYLSRFSKSVRDYFAGGRRIPWWISGVSLYMTNFSAWTFSAAAGFAYHTTWFGIIYFSTWSLAYLIGSQITAVRWRRSRVISPVEYTYTRYNRPTQQLLSWVISLNFVLSAGAQLSATCKLLSPLIGIDIDTLIILTGGVILLYTFLGGIWGVMITDLLQFVILISITIIITPLSLKLVGGIENLIKNLPPLELEHIYNNVYYDINWIIAIFMITTIGVAAGAAQRFYSVQDEISARKVGLLAGFLFTSVPLIFGVPPLVARILWPDLSQVDFFKGFFQPKDLVFIGVALNVLPGGLIGIFMAAMLSATMSALSSVYNHVASIVTRDIYGGFFRPNASEEEQFKFGRIITFTIGFAVIIEALIYIHSELGIFNIMVIFFTLFNMPVVVPITFGLLFKRIPRWGAFASIIWGLAIGFITKFLLGWSMGPQVYLVFAASFIILISSHKIGELYLSKRIILISISLTISMAMAILFLNTAVGELTYIKIVLIVSLSLALGSSIIYFAKLFSNETKEDKEIIDEFFRKLETPIDVLKEVYLKGEKETSTFPVIGGILMIIGLLIPLLSIQADSTRDVFIFIIMGVMYLTFGFLMFYYGKRAERKFAQYAERAKIELKASLDPKGNLNKK